MALGVTAGALFRRTLPALAVTLGFFVFLRMVSNLPSACQALIFQHPRRFASCLAGRGYHADISYQPASRKWAFRGIETGIFVLLAVLIAATALVVLRRDA